MGKPIVNMIYQRSRRKMEHVVGGDMVDCIVTMIVPLVSPSSVASGTGKVKDIAVVIGLHIYPRMVVVNSGLGKVDCIATMIDPLMFGMAHTNGIRMVKSIVIMTDRQSWPPTTTVNGTRMVKYIASMTDQLSFTETVSVNGASTVDTIVAMIDLLSSTRTVPAIGAKIVTSIASTVAPPLYTIIDVLGTLTRTHPVASENLYRDPPGIPSFFVPIHKTEIHQLVTQSDVATRHAPSRYYLHYHHV